ncbi:MAG: nicotinate-nucleotide adenylyltransferase [Granulosicoccus sp.]|nr:nicotinate-nucleotide adenylyltransferase [Granulosicoccus sp.]
MSSNRRIGLFGGTFDPVHFGHLRTAIELGELYSLNTLYLVPNHIPVHRDPARASTDQRLAMLELAISDCEALAVDSREAYRSRPSYSIDTLREIKTEHSGATLIFFMGLDAFSQFDTWYQWEDILEIANLVVVNRPDSAHSEFSGNLLLRQQASAGETIGSGVGAIEQCDVTQLAISATQIRRRIAEKRSVRFLLPVAVSEYIVHEQLYLDIQSTATVSRQE